MSNDKLYIYEAEVTRVVDGDTLDVRLDLGFYNFFEARLRLLQVDTPEIYGVKHSSEEYARGKEASKFTMNWLLEHAEPRKVTMLDGVEATTFHIQVQTYKNDTGKYGRWLAEVWAPEGTRCLNHDLEKAGHDTLINLTDEEKA